MRYQRIPVLIAALAFLICLRPVPIRACNPQQQIIQQPMAIAQQNYGCYGSQTQQVYYQPQQQLTLPEELPDTGCQQCQQQALYQPQQQVLLQQQAPAYYQPQRQVLLQQAAPTYAVQPQRQVLLQQQVQPVYAQQRQVLLQQVAPTYAVQRQRVLAVQQPANCYGGSANQVLAIQQRQRHQRQRLQLLGRRKHNAQQVVLQQSAGDYGQGFAGGGTVQTINVGRRGLLGR